MYYKIADKRNVKPIPPSPTPPTPPTPSVDIVSFGGGTDEQIVAMLEAYYNNDLTWDDMGWAVGEERLIHLTNFHIPNPDSGFIDIQDITVVILDHEHTELETPINGHTKACITVQTKELISVEAGTPLKMYIDGNTSYDTIFTKWSNLYMRTYLNDDFYKAIFSESEGRTFRNAIKSSKHYRHTDYNTSTSEVVIDKIFLPSYPEVFGDAQFNYYVPTSPVEGTIFKYYESSVNRIKYPNNNGQPAPEGDWNNQMWFMGSTSSYYDTNGYEWLFTNNKGLTSFSMAAGARGLAPAWAM